MEPKNLKFGGGLADTVLNPIVLVIVLIVGVLILFRPRHKVITPFILVSVLIPIDQVLVVGGLHFPMMRLLALFGIARLVLEKIRSKCQIFSGGINKIDLAVILFSVVTAVAGVLLFQEMGELVFQLGNMYTAFGVYFLLRFLMRSKEDVSILVRALVYVTVIVAMVMTWEIFTGHNPYALLGGARASSYANLVSRDDRFRAMGCFGHPILAGTFGAIMVPLCVLLWREGKKNRVLAALGIISATVITLTSNSSTPALAYAGGLLALCFWPLRRWLRPMRWGIVLVLLFIQMIWQHPVWYLVAKIDVSGESSSWHRFNLIDQCIRHFGEWWLIGVKSTAGWGWDMWDTANQYVSICDASGLLSFLLFLAIIVYGFKYLGRARKKTHDKNTRIFFWILGCCLFANAVAFFGISYWDQMQVVWYALLASISAAVIAHQISAQRPVEGNLSEEDSKPEVKENVANEADPMVYAFKSFSRQLEM